jgi:zinc and cadmium transporter
MGAPTTWPYLLLAIYCLLILVASLAGGWIPLFVRLTHIRLQVATSFVAGLMLGVGLLHLLPHAWQQLQSIDRAVAWLLGGFLVTFFLQRFFRFHHHDVPAEAEAHEGHAPHDHAGADHHHHGPAEGAGQLSWAGAALGLTLHTLIDGIALAASVQAEARSHAGGWLMGLGTFLVIILHKPFDAMAIGTLMATDGRSKVSRHWVNGLFALVIPLGVLLFHLGTGWYADAGPHFLGAALAFAAGTFLCISTSDLLPELQFHSHDRFKLSLALIAGLGLSALIFKFENSGHERQAPVPVLDAPARSGK